MKKSKELVPEKPTSIQFASFHQLFFKAKICTNESTPANLNLRSTKYQSLYFLYQNIPKTFL